MLAGALISPHTFKYLYIFAYFVVCVGFLRARLFTGLQSWILSVVANLIVCSLLGIAFWTIWPIVPQSKEPPSLDEQLDAFGRKFPILNGLLRENQKPNEIVQAIPVYPAVDFILAEEKFEPGIAIDHVRRLDLTVYNKGKIKIKDVRLRVTEYVLKLNTLVPATSLTAHGKYEQVIEGFTRFTEDSIIKSIATNGKSPTVNLTEMKPFHFIRPPNSGNPQSSNERYYALRFTFDGGNGGTYCHYLVVSGQYEYILPIDQPKTTATVGVDNNFPDMFIGTKAIILDHQRKLYRDSPEPEYQSGAGGPAFSEALSFYAALRTYPEAQTAAREST